MTQKDSLYDYFLAVPMSALSPDEYSALRSQITSLVKAFEEQGKRAFCDVLEIEGRNFDHPADAYQIDIGALKNSRALALIWPKATLSSAIYEAGYAAALGKPVTLFVKKREDLPFMLRNADQQTADSIKIITYNDFADIARALGITLP